MSARVIAAASFLLLAAGGALALGRHPSVAAAPGSAPAQATPPVAPEAGGPSFFEPFDRLDTRRWFISDGWVNGDQQGCTWSRGNVVLGKGVLQLVLARASDKLRPYRCAELRTNDHLGYGVYEARMRTAAGSGLNTAIFTYRNETRDEIDFEFLGRNPNTVQLNYYQAGHGGHESLPALGFDASAAFHDYAFVWAPDRLRWYVDGRMVREAAAADLPKTPGSMVLSLWNGSAAVNGWLGPMDASRTPAVAEYDWVAFTRAGERCRFPESITCKLG